MDGKPAATSLLFMNSGTAGIYYVSTLPEYRNKGLGFYVTLAAMRAAKDAGYGEVILQATPDGEKVYRRIGFIEYCKAQIYKPDRFKN
jgi:predicted acetyltransferase